MDGTCSLIHSDLHLCFISNIYIENSHAKENGGIAAMWHLSSVFLLAIIYVGTFLTKWKEDGIHKTIIGRDEETYYDVFPAIVDSYISCSSMWNDSRIFFDIFVTCWSDSPQVKKNQVHLIYILQSTNSSFQKHRCVLKSWLVSPRWCRGEFVIEKLRGLWQHLISCL